MTKEERDLKICMAVYNATFESCQDGDGEVDFEPILANTPPEPVAVPEGWKLVPVEPTIEMIAAFKSHGVFEGAYRAMLATAPQPKAQQPAHALTDDEIFSAVGSVPLQKFVSDDFVITIARAIEARVITHALSYELINLIREAANALDDLTPSQTPETSAAREIANDLRKAIGAKIKC